MYSCIRVYYVLLILIHQKVQNGRTEHNWETGECDKSDEPLYDQIKAASNSIKVLDFVQLQCLVIV